MRALHVPGMFRNRQQEAFVIQIQSGLHQMSGGFVDVQLGEALQLVIGARFQLSVAPDVADAQQRQGADRDPRFALLPCRRGGLWRE